MEREPLGDEVLDDEGDALLSQPVVCSDVVESVLHPFLFGVDPEAVILKIFQVIEGLLLSSAFCHESFVGL